ncbi:MAG: hypothetical protein JKY43_09725 [Phycisphaerales bacterium]|nr:hypothetical protein [Phycisphaerales bacterium]
MSDIEKKCIICGQSCAGQPRIKDASGNYAHKACAQKQMSKKSTKAAQPEIDPLDLSPEEEPEMASFLDDLPSTSDIEPSAMRAACPGCGASVSSDSMICISCGCNIKTGRGSKAKIAKVKAKKNGPSLGAKVGSLAIAPFLPIVGAIIGGAIGAAVWAAISHFTGYEIGYVAIGVGFICGIGAVIGSGGEGGAWSGTVAIVVTLLAIVTGKAIVNSIYVDNLQQLQAAVQAGVEDKTTLEEYSQEEAIMGIASDIAWDREEAGQKIDWPNPEINLYETLDLSDFPQDIIDQTNSKWDSMSTQQQTQYRQDQVDRFNEDAAAFSQMLTEEMASSTSVIDNLSPIDALWAFLALGAAWSVGSGRSED